MMIVTNKMLQLNYQNPVCWRIVLFRELGVAHVIRSKLET